MFCLHCGQQLPPDAFFCPNCGHKVEASPDTPGGDASGQAIRTETPAPDASAQTVRTGTGAPVKIETYMNYAIVITVLGTFNCGLPFTLVLGIAAIYYADKADRAIRSGDYKKAEGDAQTAKMLCIITTAILVFIFLGMLLCFTLMLLSATVFR